MELLFKAKSIAEDVPEDLEEFQNEETIYGFPVIVEGKTYMLKGIVEADSDCISAGCWCEVNPKTIKKYTNWRDSKRGKKIFDGDVVSQYNFRGDLIIKGRVKFKNGCWVISDKKSERKLYTHGVNTRLEDEGY